MSGASLYGAALRACITRVDSGVTGYYTVIVRQETFPPPDGFEFFIAPTPDRPIAIARGPSRHVGRKWDWKVSMDLGLGWLSANSERSARRLRRERLENGQR